ncbi:MAG: leukotoxin LktA family filamentous adhesin, partial [Phascolarctobacterium sp.]
MSTKRKTLRYGLKKQELDRQSKNQSLATSMKLLRSVLAVGFAITPFLGGREALAGNGIVRVDGATGVPQGYLQNANDKVAHIYAEQASGSTGLNRFKYFDVGAGQIANLYFQKQGSTATLNTLVNTVENQINISGTVNAVRNNKIGGNLYFLSPKGMVVGAGGVINAGALTVIGTGTTFSGSGDDAAAKAAEAIVANNWSLEGDSKIEINGQINAMTGIDLRAASIALQKDTSSNGNALLQTGVVFNNVVNTDGLYSNASVNANDKLVLVKDKNKNIVIKDSSGAVADVNGAAGLGNVALAAEASSRNDSSRFGQVSASVSVSEDAKIESMGDVNISANATRQNSNTLVEIWDIMAYTKASVNIDGAITGNNVNIAANATSSYEAHNAQNIFVAGERLINMGIDAAGGGEIINVNETLATAIYDKFLEAGIIAGNSGNRGQVIASINNLLEQLYMPFGLVDAEASINQGTTSVITARENASFSAISSAANKQTVSIQPRLEDGHTNLFDHFGGGLVLAYTDSDANIDLKGEVHAAGNLTATAKAANTSVGSMVLKFPKVVVPKTATLTTESGSPYVAAALVINLQDTDAVVNFGTEKEAASTSPKIKAGGDLVATAASINTLSSNAVVAEKEDTAVNTAINIGVTSGAANVNTYTTLQGNNVQLDAQNLLNSISLTTDTSSGIEFSGTDWWVNLPATKEGVQKVGAFINLVKDGPRVRPQREPIDKVEWDKAFNVGASLTVAVATNTAKNNVASNAKLLASGDLNVLASSTIGDSVISTKNLYSNMGRPEYVAVSTAIGVEVLENTAEVNIENASSSDAGTLSASGNVNIYATADNAYNRVDKLLAAVESGWADFLAHYADWSTAGVAEKVQDLQEIVADILTMRANDSAQRFADSKQYTMKAKAAIDLVTQLTGTDKLKSSLEALCNAANYANMYVSASTDKTMPKLEDAAAVATAAIGVQYLENNAKVNIGANRNIVGGDDKAVKINAKVIEQDANLIGKWSFVPDLFNTNAGATGIGGSVHVQTAYNTSEVTVNKGVDISAGDINIATDND